MKKPLTFEQALRDLPSDVDYDPLAMKTVKTFPSGCRGGILSDWWAEIFQRGRFYACTPTNNSTQQDAIDAAKAMIDATA